MYSNTFVLLPFQVICSYLFMPLAYLMGVEWKDAGVVAELIGIKTFLTEFIAYDHLSGYMANRIKCQAGTVISVSSRFLQRCECLLLFCPTFFAFFKFF